MNVNVLDFYCYLLLDKLLKPVPLMHLSLWTFQVFRAMTQAKVLMSLSWTKKKASSPHEPSGSWFDTVDARGELRAFSTIQLSHKRDPRRVVWWEIEIAACRRPQRSSDGADHFVDVYWRTLYICSED